MGEQITPQTWMNDPDTSAVIGCLRKGGGTVRFVGGCVRDALLTRPIGDIDIATDLPPETVMRLFEDAGIRCIPTGIDHGTVTAVYNHKPFEITTLRRDEETDGRRAVVSFTDDWREDAARRDFTMNALYLDPEGTIHDYFNGVGDARSGHIRFVGDAITRIEEDVLRLLRFFRFYARYGKGAPDRDAIAACHKMAPELPRLAPERVRVELIKLLLAHDPVPALRLMHDCEVFAYLSNAGPLTVDDGDLTGLGLLIAREEAHAEPNPVRRLAALFYRRWDAAEAERHATALRLSNAERDRLVAILRKPFVSIPPTDPVFYEQYYKAGPNRTIDAALVEQAVGAAGDWDDIIAYAHKTGLPQFQVYGRDLIDRGVEPGEAMGQYLRRVKAWWVANGFQPDRDACLTRLDQELAQSA